MSDSESVRALPRPELRLHPHDFPNGAVHRHTHPFEFGHPSQVNQAHPQPYYFLCADCEPERAKIAAKRHERNIAAEWSDD